MPNIAITSYCNLKCPYCFANSMINETKINNISINNFNKILNWLEPSTKDRNNPIRIGLFGGEPLLHPNFLEILNLTENFCLETYSKSILFTNGINLNKNIIKKIPAKMEILINFNHPNLLSIEQQKQFNTNLKLLNDLGWIYNNHVTLGCNLYQERSDYSYFKNFILNNEIKIIRLAVASINNNLCRSEKNKNYYLFMKPIFLNFVYFCLENNIKIIMDCRIPINYFNEQEQKDIFSVIKKEKYLNICKPPIDISPDGKVSSCFGKYSNKVNYYDFKNYEELFNYFLQQNKIIEDL